MSVGLGGGIEEGKERAPQQNVISGRQAWKRAGHIQGMKRSQRNRGEVLRGEGLGEVIKICGLLCRARDSSGRRQGSHR